LNEGKIVNVNNTKKDFIESIKIKNIISNRKKGVKTHISSGDGLGIDNKIKY